MADNLHEKQEADDELKLKRVEFYSVALSAWYNTAMELDKSLLTLSIAGLGFLLSLLISNKEVTNAWFFILFILSVIAFLICIYSVLKIFSENQTHISQVLNSQVPTDLEPYDKTKWISFFIAIFFSVLTVGSYQILSFQEQSKKEEEQKMAKNQNPLHFTSASSVNGVQTLAPSGVSIESFQGVINVQPTTTTQPISPPASPSNPSTK